jgi:hypothetical protein
VRFVKACVAEMERMTEQDRGDLPANYLHNLCGVIM